MIKSPEVLVAILGGGRGTRLFPLTKDRAKPAVPLAGKYRLIDIPISNCLNSGYNRIFVITQFMSASLNRHLSITYRFDSFTAGFIEVLAAEERSEDKEWYLGTADAVRRNLQHIDDVNFRDLIVLSGDQLYRMDLRDLYKTHVTRRADITIACIAVRRDDAKRMGVMQLGAEDRIVRFEEKPQDPAVLDSLPVPTATMQRIGVKDPEKRYMASMGIYVIRRDLLHELLASGTGVDFGSEIIPRNLQSRRVFAHLFDGYWEDVGTIRSFYDVHLDLVSRDPPFDFYDALSPTYTRARYLPPAKVHSCVLESSMLADGCRIRQANIVRSVIGIRSVIAEGVRLEETIMMGADYYEDPGLPLSSLHPALGVGAGTVIRRAVIDKNARIGRNVRILNEAGVREADGGNYCIREGIVVIPKNAVIPDGTTI